jgi:predicted nucleic acid-binding protein
MMPVELRARLQLVIRSIEEDHQQQDEALDAINKLVGRGEDVFLLPQFLYEFWVVATRPKKDNGLGLNTTDTETFLAKFESVFPIKYDTEAVYNEWRRLVTSNAVQGKPSHDARIAATLTVHGIGNLVTFNKDRFKRFSSITPLLPSEV